MKMGKFKWLAALCIVFLLILGPIGFLFLPSWNTKLNPMLNLVDTMMGAGGEDNLAFSGFAFVDSDEVSLTLRIDLEIDNSEGEDMIFPALNLTFNYGAAHLGDGWINPEVEIPAGSSDTVVSIFARMFKGDAFNQFLMSIIGGGGLSLSISSGEAFIFLETFGGTPAGVLSIPLPSIPLPAVEFGEEGGWPPTIHELHRGNVDPNQPVEVKVSVSDRGSGVAQCILSWSVNGTSWQNTTMTGLPIKPLLNGNGTSVGQDLNNKFPNYPDSPIPTCWGTGVANATILPYSTNSVVKYRVYVIDDFNYTTLVPSSDPTQLVGTDPDALDLTNYTFTYVVNATTLANFTAIWEPVKQDGDDEETDIFADLEAAGIDIMDALVAGVPAFANLDLDNMTKEMVQDVVFDLILPIVEYLEFRGVNPFELVDQLLGLSGGVPGLDDNITSNANTSLALDLLAEGGLRLTDLMELLEVNLTAVVDAIGDSIEIPLAYSPDLDEALLHYLNQTYTNPSERDAFMKFLANKDAHFYDLETVVIKHDRLLDDYTDVSEAANNASVPLDLHCDDTTFYIGSPVETSLTGGETPGRNFTCIQFAISTPTTDPLFETKTTWEFYNGSGVWLPLTINTSATEGWAKPGRITFVPTETMQAVEINGIDTTWVRMNITAPLTGTGPIVDRLQVAVDYIPYYIEHLWIDVFGRSEGVVIPGENDNFANLLAHMNSSNEYALLIWNLLDEKGVSFTEFIDEIGGSFWTYEGPVTGTDILESASPIMGIIVYGILLLGVIAALRGRKGTYAISPVRVKKWYGSMQVTPSLKTREELEQYKLKHKG